MGAFRGVFYTRESGAVIPVTNDHELITFNVEEIPVMRGDGTVSTARLTIGNLNVVNEGIINNVIVLHKKSSETDYKQVAVFATEWKGTGNGGVFDVPGIDWIEDGITHDFRVFFTNADSEPAIEDGSGDVWGDDIFLQALNVVFDGYPDLSEYPAATGLLVVNAQDPDGGVSGDQPSPIPPSGIAKLQWDDMRLKPTGTYEMADGSQKIIYDYQWRNLRGYRVYMIILNSRESWPSKEVPTDNEPNGTWYKVAETKDNYVEIDCPRDKYVGFYVVCLMKLAAPSPIDSIPQLSYGQYSSE